jgi:catechol 2,3-dioxygenase-like lactoylglutathione lyase family enzyme
MLAHIGLEVADLQRSARFYDALFGRLGARRVFASPAAIAYGRVHADFWIVQRGLPPQPGYGHVAIEAAGRAAVDAAYATGLEHGGRETDPPSPPGHRPQYGASYYAAYLLDPDGLRLEVVSGGN